MYAAVDLGSNSFRLHLGKHDGFAIRVLKSMREPIRLAAGLDEAGNLSEAAIQRAIACLKTFRLTLAAYELDAVRVVATSTMRQARNVASFLPQAEEAIGSPIEIISGEEAGRLIYMGVANSLAQPNERRLVVDIGGGSTELVPFRNRAPRSAVSLPFGSLSLFKKHVSGLFPTPSERTALRDLALREAERARTNASACSVLLGAGGTIQSAALLAGTVFGRDPECGTFSAEEAGELLRRLQSGSREALLTILQTVPDRVHTLIPGLIILGAILKVYGVETIQTSRTDIREGYLLNRILI